ncbi:hypothetical protein THAOC_27759, partial [Thalassiosira oceanica]
ALSNANCIVFGCGSLFTSVLPSLVLDGVGEAVARARSVPKVLLLNGWHDRETCWSETDTRSGELVVKRMDATDFVKAIVDALDQGNGRQIPLVTDYITHIFSLRERKSTLTSPRLLNTANPGYRKGVTRRRLNLGLLYKAWSRFPRIILRDNVVVVKDTTESMTQELYMLGNQATRPAVAGWCEHGVEHGTCDAMGHLSAPRHTGPKTLLARCYAGALRLPGPVMEIETTLAD